MNLIELPKDVLLDIFMELEPSQLYQLYNTCKAIFNIMEDNLFWRKYYVNQQFGKIQLIWKF